MLQAKLEPFEGVFNEYSTIVIQVGYLVLFAPAFPVAAGVCYVSFLFEMRTDAFKLLANTQRPKYLGAQVQRARCGATTAINTSAAPPKSRLTRTLTSASPAQHGHPPRPPAAPRPGLPLRRTGPPAGHHRTSQNIGAVAEDPNSDPFLIPNRRRTSGRGKRSYGCSVSSASSPTSA